MIPDQITIEKLRRLRSQGTYAIEQVILTDELDMQAHPLRQVGKFTSVQTIIC